MLSKTMKGFVLFLSGLSVGELVLSSFIVLVLVFGSALPHSRGITLVEELEEGYTVYQITNNTNPDNVPQIHNGQVTWYGHDGSDNEIYMTLSEHTETYDVVYDSETRTITTAQDNTIPLTIFIDGETFTINPGESYTLTRIFTLNLYAGWNMVSLPFLPEDPSTSSVLSDAGYYQLVTWIGTGYVVATEFELGKGYWLLVLEDTNITITG